MIPESFNYLRVLILDLLSVFGLLYLDPFLVLKLIPDVVTINCPNMVDKYSPKLSSFDLQPLSRHILRHAVPGHYTTPCSYCLDYLYGCGICCLSHDLFRRTLRGLLMLYLFCLFPPY